MKPTVQAKEWEMTYEQERKVAGLISKYYFACGTKGFAKANPIYEKLIHEVEKFISSTLAEAQKETIQEAIDLFKKYKDEPMTGNVVILELKVLKENL